MNRRSSLRPAALTLTLALLLALAAGGCGGGGEGSDTSTRSQAEAPSSSEPEAPPAPKGSIAAEEAEATDKSIQEYGEEAEGDEEEEVVAAMRSFLTALATSDYAEICAGLTSSNRQQLESYLKLQGEGSGGCASVLKTIVVPTSAKEAKKAATAMISRVRIGEGNAFVLFRPAGGKLSYFVMKDEDGAWKATSVAPGIPLAP